MPKIKKACVIFEPERLDFEEFAAELMMSGVRSTNWADGFYFGAFSSEKPYFVGEKGSVKAVTEVASLYSAGDFRRFLLVNMKNGRVEKKDEINGVEDPSSYTIRVIKRNVKSLPGYEGDVYRMIKRTLRLENSQKTSG